MNQFKDKIEKAKTHFINELKSMRTGRANPGMVEDILAESYGQKTPLKHLANIAAASARVLTIEPWDKNNIKEIEKAIGMSSLGLTPTVDGNILRLKLPDATEENRKNMARVVNEKLENSRVNIRQARDEEKKEIDSKARKGELTEDDKYSRIKKLDEETRSAITELEDKAKTKEQEIMAI